MSNFYNQASWVLVPSGIEEDIVFAQKPISGLGDLTFTRASDATYTDASGVVRRSPYNLLQYSELLDNTTGWSILGTRFTSSKVTGPTGTNNAYLFTEVAATDSHNVFTVAGNRPTSEAGRTYTVSAYFKAGTRRYCGISVGIGGSGVHVFVDTTNWTITDAKRFSTNTNWVYLSSAIQADLNGFYRVSLTFRTDAALSMSTSIFASNVSTSTAGEPSYLGDGSTIITTGAQLVEGSSALDYFPTTNRQDVPRIDFRNADGTLSSCGRLLLEPQRTNSIRNSSMVGAVAGTPGTLPTNWAVATAGLTQTISIGTESGLPYIDLRFAGTATGSIVRINSETTTQIAATNGQTWTSAIYMKLVSGTYNSSINGISLRAAGGVGISALTASMTLTSALQRFIFVGTTNNATVAFVQPQIDFLVTIGQTYDFTIRIAAPQMELGAYATTWVPTTTAAVTRLADFQINSAISSFIGGTSGTWLIELDMRSTPLSGTNAVIGAAGVGKNIGIANSGNSNTFRLNVNGITDAISQNITNTFKMAISFDPSGVVCFIDGQEKSLPNTSTQILSGLTSVSFSTGTRFEYINLHQSAFFPTRLTNAELAQLTTL